MKLFKKAANFVKESAKGVTNVAKFVSKTPVAKGVLGGIPGGSMAISGIAALGSLSKGSKATKQATANVKQTATPTIQQTQQTQKQRAMATNNVVPTQEQPSDFMDKVTEFFKKYWMYIVGAGGALIVLYLLLEKKKVTRRRRR